MSIINDHGAVISNTRNHKRIISFVLLLAFCNLMGCNYYRVRNVPIEDKTLQKTTSPKKYVVLHTGGRVWHLFDVIFDKDKQEIRASVNAVNVMHESYKTAREASNNQYKSKEASPFNEIHLYINQGFIPDSHVVIPVSSVSKIEVYDQSTGLKVLSVSAVVVSIVAVLAAIIALTKSSCPFIYIENGNSYVFTGEMYGGAIYPSLERDDYMLLPNFTSRENAYRLMITNELLERQHTNLAELLVVQHQPNTAVLLDKNGNVQTIIDPRVPLSAVADDGHNYLPDLITRDTLSHLFHNAGSDAANKHIDLNFEKPDGARHAKLILNAKNSLWLDYTYGEFNELFGTLYNRFAEKQKKKPAQELKDWSMQQSIPLSVYIETKEGWKFVDYFDVVGPLAARDLVMPIDLAGVDSKQVKVRLQCGFMFWEVDYAAIDFSEDDFVDITRIKPSDAIDENGNNVKASLTGIDDNYLIQPEVGNQVKVTYQTVATNPSLKETVFLHSHGYYTYIRDYKNKPQLKYLKSFKQPGSFARFSKERFDEILRQNEIPLTSVQ
jgi:hypothetical protein